MVNFAMFKQHVDGVHRAARIVIEKQNSKALWPTLTSNNTGDTQLSVEFTEPAILWDAPIRASTTGGRAKRAIVMDGCFYFNDGAFDKGSASLEIYSITRHQGVCTLDILEAMHFDIEPNELQSPFHPMFHVQFGKNHRLDLGVLQNRVAQLARVDTNQVQINRDLSLATRDVRIPTPQMDYLSVLAMVVADYFCEKNSTHEVKSGFKNLLKKIMDSKNSARNGRQSIRLEKRWADATKPFCASHWYEESCN